MPGGDRVGAAFAARRHRFFDLYARALVRIALPGLRLDARRQQFLSLALDGVAGIQSIRPGGVVVDGILRRPGFRSQGDAGASAELVLSARGILTLGFCFAGRAVLGVWIGSAGAGVDELGGRQLAGGQFLAAYTQILARRNVS